MMNIILVPKTHNVAALTLGNQPGTVMGAMIPTFTAFAIVQFLEQYFDDLVNLKYTSNMEDDLDSISRGENSKIDYLNGFYFGDNELAGLKTKLEQEFDKNKARLISTMDINGQEIEIRIGRYGIYGQKGEERFTIPIDLPPSDLNGEKIAEIIEIKNNVKQHQVLHMI